MTPFQLAITLDRADRTYLEGDRITGTVALTGGEPLEIRELTVELGHQFSGKRGQGEGTEASALLFEGHWTPGARAIPFDLPVTAELPTYQGQLFSITRMVRARAVVAHQAPVVDVAVVNIACRPREEGWFDPREQQLPPVIMVVNGAPVRFTGLKRAAEAGVGLLLGRRPPASVEVTPRVPAGGGTVAITVRAHGGRRLGGLRARLRGVEVWPRDQGAVTRVVHQQIVAPTIIPGAEGTTLRFEVPVPEDAFSIEPLLQWRIELHGAYGCLDHRDRWQPLWVGPSPSSLERLRRRPAEELAATAHTLGLAAATRRRRSMLVGGLALLILGVLPAAFVVLSAPPDVRNEVLEWAAGIALVIALLLRRRWSLNREFRERLYLDGTTAPAPPASPAPTASTLPVELLTVGESAVPPDTLRRLRGEAIVTQRRALHRGAVGLVLLIAINVVAGLAKPMVVVPPWIGIPLTILSVVTLVASVLVKPTGRPLSCYVGLVPLLVAAWLVVSVGRAVASAAVAIMQQSAPDAVAALLLAAGALGIVLLARRQDSSSSRGRALLVLWVFGASSRMEEIMREVALQWAYIGPIQYLRGPGSRPDLGRLVAALRGGARELFAATQREALAHLRRFRFTPNIFGIYSLNSIQCTDAVWRDALDALVDTTDLVMMDLTAFGKNNRGCAYELGVLLARLHTSRFVLVVDGTTDIGQLTQVLQEQWSTVPPDSPNRGATPAPVRVLRIPLREASSEWHPWRGLPMNDLVQLLYQPIAADAPTH